jgi:hypothetical protein
VNDPIGEAIHAQLAADLRAADHAELARSLRNLGLRARIDGDSLLVSTLNPGLIDRTSVRLSVPEAEALLKAWDGSRPDELLVLFAQHHRGQPLPAQTVQGVPAATRFELAQRLEAAALLVRTGSTRLTLQESGGRYSFEMKDGDGPSVVVQSGPCGTQTIVSHGPVGSQVCIQGDAVSNLDDLRKPR